MENTITEQIQEEANNLIKNKKTTQTKNKKPKFATEWNNTKKWSTTGEKEINDYEREKTEKGYILKTKKNKIEWYRQIQEAGEGITINDYLENMTEEEKKTITEDKKGYEDISKIPKDYISQRNMIEKLEQKYKENETKTTEQIKKLEQKISKIIQETQENKKKETEKNETQKK